VKGRSFIAAAFLMLPALALGQAEVISPRPDAVSITIYRDLFALITETRTVDLPADAHTLSFEGVVETLIPESAVVAELGRGLEERNYDYDQLTPNTMLEKSVGKTVTLTRTMPGSGKVKQVRATIVSANPAGIVLRTEQGNEAMHCSGIPEHLTFDEIPADLHPKPKLSIRLAAGTPGKRTIRLSYLAQGFAWSSDYVARLNATGNRMDIRGWVTLRNFTAANFRQANVQVVAGKLHLLDADERGTSTLGDTDDYEDSEGLRGARAEALQEMQDELDEEQDTSPTIFSGCHSVYPGFRFREAMQSRDDGLGSIGMNEIDEVIVTGLRKSSNAAVREELGDYQLYRLPWATDLNARQTKQAVFLEKPGVKIERFYGYRFDAQNFSDDDAAVLPASILSFENKKSSGLGEPLPEGVLRLFESTDTGDVFAGEAQLSDQAVGLPVEATVARAIDLQFEVDVDRRTEEDRDGEEVADIADVVFRVLNSKQMPVTVEIRQMLDADTPNAKVVASNHRVGRKYGDYAWRFRVPANGGDTLTYRLRMPSDDPDKGSE
jgi:hypothetical protein